MAGSVTNVRAGLGLIDNTIRGNHAAAMADLIREFKDSAVVMAALPFAVTIGGIAAVAGIAVEVASKIKEWKESQQQLTQEQMKFGTTINETYNGLDEKILSAEQKTDELRNDHLGALSKELQLIDKQSFSELLHSFETVAKAADTVFGDLKGNWYTFGIGSAGAQHALTQFQSQYESLLAQGKQGEAADLLKGTRDSAQKVLEAQHAYNNSRTGGGMIGPSVDYTKQYAALATLRAAGVSSTEKEIAAQQTLVDALNAQLNIEQKVSTLKGIEADNAKRTTGNDAARQAAEGAKEAAASQLRMGEMVVASDRAVAAARLEISHASIQQRLESEIDFSNRELAVQLAGNAAQIAALDKSSKDYTNQLKALNDKALELQQQHDSQIATLTAQSQAQQAAQAIRAMEGSEREKINATQQGSVARLAAIDAAIAEEAAHNLKAEDSYRALANQRVETIREMAQSEADDKAKAAQLAAASDMKMAQLGLAALKEQQAVIDSARHMTDAKEVAEATQQANALYKIQLDAGNKEIAALNKNGKDYETKLIELQNKQKQLTQQHENEITAIQDKATIARNQTVLSAYSQFESSIAKGLTSVLMGHQTFASMMNSIGSQVAEGMIQNSLKDLMALDMTREREAAAAARKMYLAGSSLPFPANIVMGPVLAAGAFSAVMAYNSGTDMVPGVGRGDVVPAMLEPGEGVVPGGVMDGLRNMVRNGSMGGQSVTHIHVRPTYNVQAIDGKGMGDALEKHSAVLQKHFEKSVRRMNK
ncbi:hypothetical protein [Edaphobacter dinghuensis]|nr:hypothetical protein [Edaphobacter dinghuensis]